MLGFGQFLAAADALIAAEVDLAGHGGHDPAVDAWFTAAEKAREIVLHIIKVVADFSVVEPGDDHLLGVMDLFQTVMLSEDPEEISGIQFRIAEMPQQFFALGIEGVEGCVNRLILQGLDRFEQYLLTEEVKQEPHAVSRIENDLAFMPMF
ncbi:MAG: hypothetical protein ACMUJJ_01705 [Roseicyclus sp.]|uniref:hypothetical protein n=1 Tax=Roseicyclus sp. TaxID=1914329 RepID=UPI003A836446